MINLIIENIDDPEGLEKLYRKSNYDFKRAFAEAANEYDSDLVQFWKIRLDNETESEFIGFSKTDLIVVIFLSLATGLLIKLPDIFTQIDPEFFFPQNLAIILFNGLILYTFWQNRIFNHKRILGYAALVLILLIFVNLLPGTKGDSVNLAFIHVPLFLWCLFGLTYISFDHKNIGSRIEFIRFNGELLIMSGLLLIAGVLLTGITVGLFSVINMNIEEFYMQNVAVFGGAAAPIVAFYLTKIYPNITSRIAPVIARIFAPCVLITLIVYLVSILFSDASITQDRELLAIFNLLLLAVMAIIVFSVTELNRSKEKNINVLILFALAVFAVIINSIALYAIITRIAEGITPNRTAVLLSNILIFSNLILVTKDLYFSYYKIERIESVERTVAKYLTVYCGYTVFMIYIFPIIFGFE